MGEYRHSIEQIVGVLVDRGVVTKGELIGCSPSEIAEIEKAVGQRLPAAYREFLAAMGSEMGDFYRGTDVTFRWLPRMTGAARKLVSQNESELELPSDAIAFLMHQGYQFMFMRAGEGDDPPVYYYMEESGEFTRLAESFTQFLFDVAHDDW